jgi:D-glycero-D-manno-heptose 1,7-bisphosphate phosphatase
MDLTMSHKVVFLDRDGVLNALVERDGKMVSPRLFKDFRILDGVNDAVAELCRKNFELVVVTNQPDISRGLMMQSELDLMTKAVFALGVHHVFICPHSDEDSCLCRKPKPGLLTQYLDLLDCKPTELWMIGDREVDMQAGTAVGARTIHITSGGQGQSISFKESSAKDLQGAIRRIIDN